MRHTLGIQSYYYDCIKKGTKKIELRLLDEKRKAFKIGDEIEIFRDPERKESFLVQIKALLVYNTFEDILNDYPISLFGDENTKKEELLKELLKFYPIEEQKALNVVGIKVEVIDK